MANDSTEFPEAGQGVLVTFFQTAIAFGIAAGGRAFATHGLLGAVWLGIGLFVVVAAPVAIGSNRQPQTVISREARFKVAGNTGGRNLSSSAPKRARPCTLCTPAV